MADDKDISEIIEEEAAALEAADDDTVESTDTTDEETSETEETETSESDEQAESEDETKPADEVEQPEIVASEAPEHWEESIRDAFNKADPTTQQVWLNQQKEFQRGFNTVSQEAASLRRYQEQHVGVQSVLDQVIPAWQAQGMTPEQGLGQLVQLGLAYASNPQQTLIHLAEMAGLNLKTLGEDAPYRTTDDISRDNRMNALENRLATQDRDASAARMGQLESEIANFQADTDAEGNLSHPYFAESMDAISALFKTGYTGSLNDAYEQVIWTTPATRAKLMAAVPAKPVVKTTQQQNADAERAKNASNQRVKQARPAPNDGTDMDDLSQDDLVARVAANMEAAG